MEELNNEIINQHDIVVETITGRILQLRGEKVILDMHLADLYGVETRVLKQAVRRNIERFPASDFMFELTDDEIGGLVSQFVIGGQGRKHLGGAKPFAFTEAGVAMLSGVLKSPKAIEMNIAIMRTFVALRRMPSNYKEIMQIITEMRKGYDGRFEELYTALDKLVRPPQPPRVRIGFRRADETD